MTLAWDDAQTGLLGWRLYRATNSGQFALVTTATTKTATVESISTVTNLFFVKAFNSIGESLPSNIVTVNPTVTPTNPPPATMPPAPILRANQVTGHRLDLSITGMYDATTEIERSVEGAPFTRITTLPAGVLHYSDTSVQKKYDYQYRARQLNRIGAGAWSGILYYSSR